MQILILLGNSFKKSTSTFTLAQLGLDWFLVARSTCSGLPTDAASENKASSPKKLGGNAEKEIHATAIDVSSTRLNKGSHYSVRIGKVLFRCMM